MSMSCSNRWPLFKSLRLVAAALAAFAPGVRALHIELGDTWSQVLATHGKPSRVIETGSGTLAFYGSLLVGFENGTVRFLSRGESDPLQAPKGKREPAGAAAAAPSLPLSSAGLLKCASAPAPRTWIEEGQERHAKMLAERMRRCLAFEVYGRMLSQVSWRTYYDGRHYSYNGCGTLEQYLHHSRAREGDVGDGVTLVELRDSQSVRIDGHGTDVSMRDRSIAMQQSMRFSTN